MRPKSSHPAVTILLVLTVLAFPARSEVGSTTSTDVQSFDNSLVRKPSKENSPKQWASSLPAPTAKVLSVDKGTISISQDDKHAWKIGDQVCLTTNQKQISCGEVILTTKEQATVKLNRVIPLPSPAKVAKQAKPPAPVKEEKPREGDEVWRKEYLSLLKRTLALVAAKEKSPQPAPNVNVHVHFDKPPSASSAAPATSPVPQPESGGRRARTVASQSTEEISRYHFRILPGVGVATHAYKETDLSNLYVNTLEVRLGAEVTLTESRWMIGMDGSLSGLSLSSNKPDVATRFFNIDGYTKYFFSDTPWAAGLGLGMSYRGMIVSPADFGFTRVNELIFFPVVIHSLSSSDALELQLKYAPVVFKSSIISFSQRELGAQLTYLHRLGSDNVLSAGVLYRRLTFEQDGIEVENSSATLNFGFGW